MPTAASFFVATPDEIADADMTPEFIKLSQSRVMIKGTSRAAFSRLESILTRGDFAEIEKGWSDLARDGGEGGCKIVALRKPLLQALENSGSALLREAALAWQETPEMAGVALAHAESWLFEMAELAREAKGDRRAYLLLAEIV